VTTSPTTSSSTKVRAVGDREPLVGPGEEEVEPRSGGQRHHISGYPVAVRGYRDHHDDQNEGELRVVEIARIGTSRTEAHA
jgi:hypothetical protein